MSRGAPAPAVIMGGVDDRTQAPAPLEIRGAATGLLDDPLLMQARGAGRGAELVWRARLRDDDGRVWRATAPAPEGLGDAWVPSKVAPGPIAALASLHPVAIEVRVQAPDGRAATRELTRVLLGDGVRRRRWRDGLSAALFLPAAPEPCAVVLADATAGDGPAAVAALAAPLLASRGVLVLAVTAARGRPTPAEQVQAAAARLGAVPGVRAVRTLRVAGPADAGGDGAPVVVLPPGIAVAVPDPAAVAWRAAAWDALLADLGATARRRSERA
ncbi:hypothetical protein [Baekduia soli]|uniref:hypothetical protein n=1 Tax=Baekduia soli TaxID=496014 RepID=UPI001651EB48|nr:hypothetical protein [Baekduia soli]